MAYESDWRSPKEVLADLEKQKGIKISPTQLRLWGEHGFVERRKKNGAWHYLEKDYDRMVKIYTLLQRPNVTYEDVKKELEIVEVYTEYAEEREKELSEEKQLMAIREEAVAVSIRQNEELIKIMKLIADENQGIKETLQHMYNRLEQQEKQNQEMMTLIQEKDRFIEESLKKRDTQLMETLKGFQEAAATKHKKKWFWQR